MPVDTQHKSYDAYVEKWQRARDACAGQASIHARTIAYLPKLKDQTDDDYKAMLLRASYFNAAGRTLDGLVGMVFRKAPQVESSGIDNIVADVDLQGNDLETFAQYAMREIMTVSRFGVLVEYPQVADVPKTQAQAQSQNLRPYLSKYPTESIINWEVSRINNLMQPSFMMLKECAYEAKDEYESNEIEQLRELRLVNGMYLQKIWRQNNKKEWIQFGVDIVPIKNNKPLDFIPFYSFGSDYNDLEVTDAPILPLADLNLAHYRVTADYEHGCHYTGLPMLFFAGVELGEKEKVYLGSQAAVVSPNPNAKGQFIEFTGQGLGALENNLERKEKQMAAIGARFLEQQKAGVESEGAMQMRANGENSVLGAMANLVSAQLSKMLTFVAEWAGAKGEVIIALNTDYMPVGMTAQELKELVVAWQSGAISDETLFNNLQRGEIIADSTSFVDEQEKIANKAPVLAG